MIEVRGEDRGAEDVSEDNGRMGYPAARLWLARHDASVWHSFLNDGRHALTVSVREERVDKVVSTSVAYEDLVVDAVEEIRHRLLPHEAAGAGESR